MAPLRVEGRNCTSFTFKRAHNFAILREIIKSWKQFRLKYRYDLMKEKERTEINRIGKLK